MREMVSSILLTIIFSFLWVLVLGDNKGSVKYYTDISFSDKQGIYFEKIADTDIYSSEWTLLVHFNLTPYYHQIEGIKTSINYLKDVCDKYAVDVEFEEYCIPIISQLRHQYLEIENANTLIAHQNKLTDKQKRAALGIVGSILVAHSLFGILDEECAENMKLN